MPRAVALQSRAVLWAVAAVVAVLCLALASAQTPVRIIQTARDTGDRLTDKGTVNFVKEPVFALDHVEVSLSQTYQEIFGFGGAFTEAAAYVLSLLPENVQQQVIDLYFGAGGINYTVGRIHMNSCDFSLASYSYDDTPNDFDLLNFNTSHDQLYQMPMIKRALATTANPLRFYISPWSPPAWMKSNGQMCFSYEPGLTADPRVHTSWALYFSKYISELKNRGLDVWGITVQNEPENNATWEACLYTAKDQLAFVRDYLGPRLRADHPDVRIMIWDHNKDDMVEYATTVLSDAQAAAFVDGVAFHWYAPLPYFDHVQAVHDAFPDKFVLATEACNCPGVLIDDWTRGESYGYDIIGDLQAWAIGWVDWNMLLDQDGGPNHVGNLCDAPVIANVSAGAIHVQPPYYYMGHFSRYLLPGSVRVNVTGNMHATAVRRPDGLVAVVVQNRDDGARTYRLSHGAYSVRLTLPAHGIHTLLYAPPSDA